MASEFDTMAELTDDVRTRLVRMKRLEQGVAALGYERMTPIQSQGLPILLQGRDLIAQALA